MPSGPFGAIAKQMLKKEPEANAPTKAGAKAEPKADAKAEAKPASKDTMPPKVTVSMDDAVIAGIPAQHDGLVKKPAAPVKAKVIA